jgi:hypothetical protein
MFGSLSVLRWTSLRRRRLRVRASSPWLWRLR